MFICVWVRSYLQMSEKGRTSVQQTWAFFPQCGNGKKHHVTKRSRVGQRKHLCCSGWVGGNKQRKISYKTSCVHFTFMHEWVIGIHVSPKICLRWLDCKSKMHIFVQLGNNMNNNNNNMKSLFMWYPSRWINKTKRNKKIHFFLLLP